MAVRAALVHRHKNIANKGFQPSVQQCFTFIKGVFPVLGVTAT